MKIFVAGSGKLANAILSSGLSIPSCQVIKWPGEHEAGNEKSIVIHAGSGRQLKECMAFCRRTDSILVELSTGLETETMEPDFTLILCPNTSILILKVLHLMQLGGKYFEKNVISITESHQSTKKTAPGTAYNFARALKFPLEKIESVRDLDTQLNVLGFPKEYLDKHAYHKIVIKDGSDEVTIETKVFGHASYSKGVEKIIEVLLNHPLEKGKYSVLDLIEKNLI